MNILLVSGVLVLLPIAIVVLILIHTWIEGLERKKHNTKPPVKRGDTRLLIILFPITVYVMMGTLLFLVLSVLESLIQILLRWVDNDDYKAILWHKVSPKLTLLFPITWPMVAIMVLIVLLFAILAVIWRALECVVMPVVRFVIQSIRSIWTQFGTSVQAVWEAVTWATHCIWSQMPTLFDLLRNKL